MRFLLILLTLVLVAGCIPKDSGHAFRSPMANTAAACPACWIPGPDSNCINPGNMQECGSFCCNSDQECKSTMGNKYCKEKCDPGQTECKQTCCDAGEECKTKGKLIKVGYCLGPCDHELCGDVLCCDANEDCGEISGYPACIANSCDPPKELCSGTDGHGARCCAAGSCVVTEEGYPYCNA